MIVRFTVASAVALTLTAASANAAAVYDSFVTGFLSFEVTSGDASLVTFESNPTSNSFVNPSSNAFGDAFGDIALDGTTLSVTANTDGNAVGMPIGTVASEAFGSDTLIISNNGLNPVTISFVFDYSAYTSVVIDDSFVEGASASADLVLTSGTLGQLLALALFTDVVAPDGEDIADTLTFDITIAGLDSDTVELFAQAGGFATSDASVPVAPIPLPAAGPLLIAALGGLGLIRRRARA